MNEITKQQLINIGLNEHEADAYLVLAEHSPSSATYIAKKLQQSRSTVYTSLERLIAKGLVLTTYKNEVKQFSAEGSSAIEDLLVREKRNLDEKFEIFKTLSEQLKFLSSGGAHIPNISFFEGQDSLKRVYLGMLREANKNSVMHVMRDEFKWEKEWSFLLKEEWKAKVRRLRAEKNIATRLLVNDSKIEREQANYYRGRKHLEFRYLPKSVNLKKFVIYILGDTVSILSLEKNYPIGIKIVNRHIADNFLQMFLAIWKNAKKN